MNSVKTLPALVLAIAMISSCTHHKKPVVDQSAFEPLYRAAKAVQGSTSVGVNYVKFGELLQSLATEASIAKDKAKTDNEKKLVDMYSDVLTTYNDSFAIWKSKNEAIPNKDIFGDLIPADPIIDAVTREGLTVTKEEKKSPYIASFKWRSIPADSVQVVWKLADAKESKANEYYYSAE